MGEHVVRNRAHWDSRAEVYVAAGERNWAAPDPSWGIWSISESDVSLLPDDLDGKAVVELGCGTGYVSAWLARRGTRPFGIDNSSEQLATAVRLQGEHGVHFPLLHADAEHVPFADESFDYAISEYGAASSVDFAKLPCGQRRNDTFTQTPSVRRVSVRTRSDASDATPVGGLRHRRLERCDASDEWIRLLRANGFEILDLVELQPPPGASTGYPFVTWDWARQWPSEEVWKARKVGRA